MDAKLSANTEAILLLTAPLLIVGSKSAGTVKPLSALDYDKLARQLYKCDYTPADLLGQESHAILHQCRPAFDETRLESISSKLERISRLLERGLRLSQAVERWQTRSIWVISRADPDYPLRYKHLPGRKRPPVLYGCGDRSLLQNGGLAVVGSRSVSAELIKYTENVGRLAAEAQCIVISGGADGVDQASVRGALTAGGSAVIVLPGKMEDAVMSRDNRDALMNDCLVLISPCDPRAKWSVWQAMERNKLIYGLSDAALVIESSYDQGGTWAGAVEQLDKLHLVPVYTRAVGPCSIGLAELCGKGALEWPEPETADDLRAVLASQHITPAAAPTNQTALPLAVSEVVETPDNDVERGALSVCVEEHPRASAVIPSDELLTAADRLLAQIDKPITESEAAEHLNVRKVQARDWLKQLEQAGKYQRRSKPIRYERVSQSTELLAAADRLLAAIDKPITESEAAEHLNVRKVQARDWLKQLEQAGKYQRRSKPIRYERVSQSTELLTVVDRLLTVIDKPITESEAAEHLNVSKVQASDWLKQLEQAGKYQRRSKPIRYERVSQIATSMF